MSQAFVKEGDASDDLPERPIPDRPNYVTARGLAELRRRHAGLVERRAALAGRADAAAEGERKLLDRDLRYVQARVDSAVLVERKGAAPDDVRFGAVVELRGDEGVKRFEIVGEDEADPAQGRLSWASPLALALMGERPGAAIEWEGPEGPSKAVVTGLSYPEA